MDVVKFRYHEKFSSGGGLGVAGVNWSVVFLTWVTFKISAYDSNSPAFGGFPNEVLGHAVIAANAWKSNLLLMRISIPNWLPVMAAFGAVGALYARNNGADLSPKLPRWLLVYAFVHLALFGFMVLGDGRGSSLGIGALIMIFALGGLWKTIIKTSKVKDFKTPIT